MDELLSHYERELSFIKTEAANFARRHPKIAGRLQFDADELQDPLIEKLISAFALLNARTQNKLDDEFPELTSSLMEILYPQYTQPIPPISIAQFSPQSQIGERTSVDRGLKLQTDAIDGLNCEFQSAYPVDLYPLTVDEAGLLFRPFSAPGSNTISGNAVIKIRLETSGGDAMVNEMGINSLRFYIDGQRNITTKIYELLFTQTTKIVVASTKPEVADVYLSRDSLRPVGFSEQEGLLPYPSQSFLGYRILTEFFVFPEKFMFFDICDLDGRLADFAGDDLYLYIYLNEAGADLERFVGKENFKLGCTPVVNLFEHSAEPVRIDNTSVYYPVIADVRHKSAYEIIAITDVQAVDKQGKVHPCAPFFAPPRGDSLSPNHYLWQLRRRRIIEGEYNNEVGSEVDLSFCDLEMNINNPVDTVLSVRTLCCNRNVLSKIPFQGAIRLTCDHDEVGAIDVACIVAPTPTIHPTAQKGYYNRLLSHLNLNHFSLSGDPNSLNALKEILRLYDFRNSPSTRATINSIDSLKTAPMSAPITLDNRSILCRGTDVQIEFDPMKNGGQSVFLFACVLEVFFGLYCSINSFTRVVARLTNIEKELYRWPPRAGEKHLV